MSVIDVAQPATVSEAFFAAMERANPFLSNRVNASGGLEIDVEAIHAAEFQQLLAAARTVREQQCGLGVVVFGEAGVGKSHLLARFCRWAQRERTGHVVFLHNLQARPARLARYVLKCVMATLTDAATPTQTPLYRMVRQAVLAATSPEPVELTATQVRRAFDAMAARWIAANPNAGADAPRVYQILFDYYLAANQAAYFQGEPERVDWLVRWLSGEDLSEDEAARLADLAQLPPNWLARVEDDETIKTVLLAVARLAAQEGRSLALCFDQVDNFSAEQIQALSQFLHPLIDHGQNVLVMLAGVQAKLLEYVASGAVLQAAWDRIAQDEVTLRRIRLDEARLLVVRRIEAFLEPFADVPEIRSLREGDALFPLSQRWFHDELAENAEQRPRDVLRAARRAWQGEQARLADFGPSAWQADWQQRRAGLPPSAPSPPVQVLPPLAERIDRRVSEYLAAQTERRLAHPAELPPDAEQTRGLVERLLRWAQDQPALGQTVIRQVVAVDQNLPASRRPTYNLVAVEELADGTARSVGMRFLGGESSQSVTASLRRIVEDPFGYDRVLLAVDARQPLSRTGKGGDYLRELENRGSKRFALVELQLPDCAALDAMVSAVTAAGDLDLEQPDHTERRLEPDEVKASLIRQGRYLAHPLLRELA